MSTRSARLELGRFLEIDGLPRRRAVDDNIELNPARPRLSPSNLERLVGL